MSLAKCANEGLSDVAAHGAGRAGSASAQAFPASASKGLRGSGARRAGRVGGARGAARASAPGEASGALWASSARCAKRGLPVAAGRGASGLKRARAVSGRWRCAAGARGAPACSAGLLGADRGRVRPGRKGGKDGHFPLADAGCDGGWEGAPGWVSVVVAAGLSPTSQSLWLGSATLDVPPSSAAVATPSQSFGNS